MSKTRKVRLLIKIPENEANANVLHGICAVRERHAKVHLASNYVCYSCHPIGLTGQGQPQIQPAVSTCARETELPLSGAAGQPSQKVKPHFHTGVIFNDALGNN
jgi:hypothetical protein